MSISSHVRQPDSPYHDQPLRPGEVRLLSLGETDEPSLRQVYPWLATSGTLRITMTRHKLEDKPDFAAISYVWGDTVPSITVICNGRPIQVTENVYEMLCYLRRYKRPLWVDAICFNQQDDGEKATQIPLMRRTYAQSAFVIVWMGPLPQLATNFVMNFAAVSKLAKNWKLVRRPSNFQELDWRGNRWPNDSDHFWVGLYWLLARVWFKRLWTFQEVVLAADVEIAVGALSINGGDFFTFAADGHFQDGGYIPYQREIASMVPGSPRLSELAFAACNLIKDYRMRKNYCGTDVHEISYFPALIYRLRSNSRQAKEEVDRVWATVGLLPETLQTRLAPMVDYSELGRREYWRTYIGFAKLIVELGGTFSLLLYPRTNDRDHTKLPSWCPDLSGTPASRIHLFESWHQPVESPEGAVSSFVIRVGGPSDDQDCQSRANAVHSHPSTYANCFKYDNLLRVRGFFMDTIVEVVSDPYIGAWHEDYIVNSGWEEWTMTNPRHATVMGVLQRALLLALRVYASQGAIVTDVPLEYLMCIFTDHRVSAETVRGFRNAYICLTTGGRDYFEGLDEQERVLANACIDALKYVTGHFFFATKGGRFGIATPGCQSGDRICAFYGAAPLNVLRWPGRGLDAEDTDRRSGSVEFCGLAYIPYLMEQHQREAARLANDEIFVIG
jgi:hypothetical protein